MARRAIDDGGLSHEFAVVDQDRPHVDEDEEPDIGDLLEREDEGEHVVGDGLREAVEGVERMRRKGGRHDPLVMWLMQRPINGRMMQTAMDEVDEEVREEEKRRELREIIPRPRPLGGAVVELGVPAALGDEAGGGQERHDGHGGVGLCHLETDLVLEEFGVREGRVIEEEVVGGGGDDEVEGEAEEPASVVSIVLGLGVGTRTR